MKIGSFPDKSCCVLHTLKEYLKITQEKRKSNKLFISLKTFNKVSVARWLKEVLQRSGIDDKIFSAHSYRSASISAAFAGGVQLKEILKTANWSNAKTFYTFYKRELSNPFSDTVLQTTSTDYADSMVM